MKRLIRLMAVVACFAQPFQLYADDTFFTLERRSSSISNQPTNISVITAEDIRNTGAKTLAEVLGQLTSVDVTGGTIGSFSTARIRGVPSSNQIRYFVDDQPMSGIAVDQNFDVSQIPVESIERIEVVRGGSSVLYGANTIGGVINIITKKEIGKGSDVEVGLEGGSHQMKIGRVSAAASNGLANAGVILTGYETDGFQENSDAKANNGTLNMGISSSEGTRLSLRVFHNRQEAGVPQGTLVPIDEWDGEKERPAENPTKRTEKERLEGRLGLEIPLGGLNQLAMSLYGSDAQSNSTKSINPFETDFKIIDHILGGDTKLLLEKGLTLGVEYERDYSRNTNLDPHHITNVGSYIQQEINGSFFTLIPALRYDHHSTFGSEFNPRLSAVIKADPTFSVSANIARSFRAPGFFELYGDFLPGGYVANRNLKPETAWTFDEGFSFHPNVNTEYKLTGFYTIIKDRIAGISTDANPNDSETNDNISKSDIKGVEVEARFKTGPFFHTGSYTYTRSRQSNSVTQTNLMVAVPLTPVHVANYQLKLVLPGDCRLINTGQYVSEQFGAANESGIKLPPYGLWHARLEKGFSHVNLYIGVNNILDRRYADSIDTDDSFSFTTLVPMDVRTYYGGASVKFGSVAE